MAYTAPKTWAEETAEVSDFNTYIRDNQIALKDPPADEQQANEGADWTTSSTSMVDVDATDLLLSLTTTGGDVEIAFAGTFAGGNNYVYLDVDIGGVAHAGDDGIIAHFITSTNKFSASFKVVATGLSAGAHSIKLQWKTNSGTITLYGGAGTASFDLHSEFTCREV